MVSIVGGKISKLEEVGVTNYPSFLKLPSLVVTCGVVLLLSKLQDYHTTPMIILLNPTGCVQISIRMYNTQKGGYMRVCFTNDFVQQLITLKGKTHCQGKPGQARPAFSRPIFSAIN